MDDLTNLRPSGVFLRREAIQRGYTDRDLTRARRASVIHRIRHGAYVDSATWTSSDSVGRHTLCCHAVALSHRRNVVFSHQSAAALLGCDLWGVDLDRVHVETIGENTGRRHRDVVYHESSVDSRSVVGRDGLTLVDPKVALIGAATQASVESGIVLLDSAYRKKVCDEDDLRRAYDAVRGCPGTAHLQITLRLARLGSESVGESRARYLFWRFHIPNPQLQFDVSDARGRHVGTADFAWPELGILGEFDGRIKYGRLLRPGEEPGDAIYREKVREDRMRAITGWRFFRFGWDDLAHPARTAERFHDLVRQVA